MYNPIIASFLARVSNQAYEEANIDIEGTQVLIKIHNSIIVVAFRGTELNDKETFRDTLTDFYILFNKEGMHSGFHKAYYKVHDEIKKVLDKFPDREVYLTGHSLGAALSTVAACKLRDYNLKACYNYGSPRVGNRDMRKQVACPIYRIVNYNDLIPRLPIWGLGYRHVGELHYLTRKGKRLVKPGIWTTGIKFFTRLPFRPLGTITAHSIDRYIRKLNEEKYNQRRTKSK